MRYADVLYTVARSILAVPQDAQDCVHDTVLRVWTAADSFRVERGTLRAFLVVCVRNEALTRRRAAGRHAAIERRAQRLTIDDTNSFEFVDPTLHARLQNALQSLPREQRNVIELAYAGDRTQTQIAARLGVPLGTVKSRISLGLRKLAIALGPSEL